jgi:hypothetical protein
MDLGSDDKSLSALPAHVGDDGFERTDEGSEENRRRQRMRSIAIAWALFAFAVLVFLVTIVRLGANVANRPL